MEARWGCWPQQGAIPLNANSLQNPMDLIIRRAALQGREGLHDVGIRGDRIAAIAPQIPDGAPREIDATGDLVTPALIETHIHLDAALTVGQPRHNRTGTLFEGIEIWGERVRTLTPTDVKARATTALKWMLAHGGTYVRTHVDVCDPNLVALRALLEVREEVADRITLQIVAFPQQGIYSFPDGEQPPARALELGADGAGGEPDRLQD